MGGNMVTRMTRTVDFYFDFGSPNAYLAAKVLPRIAARAGATISYRPALLGGVFKATGNVSPMQAFAPVKGKLAYEMLEMQRFVDRHGLHAFQMNPFFPINTLPLMRAQFAALHLGECDSCADADIFRETCFAAIWEEGLNMGDDAIARARIAAAGLNADRIFAAAQTSEIKQALMDATNAAVERGLFGMPTFFVGDDMFFGKDRLDQVAERLAA